MSKSKVQFEHLQQDKKVKRDLRIAHKSDKQPDQMQKKEFKERYGKFKDAFLEKNTLKSMVFENGSALALLFKEMQKLVNEVNQLKNQNNYELNKK